MDSNLKGDCRREVLRDNRLPFLKNEHPPFVVVRALKANTFQVIFRLETHLKLFWAKLSPFDSAFKVPDLRKEVNNGSSAL